MSSLEAVRARFARNEGLPFVDILTEARIREVLNKHGVQYRNRVFSPVTTIWGFLSQVLSEDRSCRDTVSRIIAHRAANGMPPCSPSTASYRKVISMHRQPPAEECLGNLLSAPGRPDRVAFYTKA